MSEPSDTPLVSTGWHFHWRVDQLNRSTLSASTTLPPAIASFKVQHHIDHVADQILNRFPWQSNPRL